MEPDAIGSQRRNDCPYSGGRTKRPKEIFFDIDIDIDLDLGAPFETREAGG